MMVSVGEFKYVAEGFLVPAISLFGLLGNLLTVIVLRDHREVKLKSSLVRILCGLATFDNVFLVLAFFMFTLPALSQSYTISVLPYVAPYLLPATNTLMTCSVYATVAVAVNRHFEMSPTRNMPVWLERGHVQSLLVLAFSVAFNASRWFELKFSHVTEFTNVTAADFDNSNNVSETVNRTFVVVQPTELRNNPTYYHWYHVVVNSAVMIVAPSVIMVYCSNTVYRRLKEAALALTRISDLRARERTKRNQSITRTLIGIILMFLLCHSGKIVITLYEVIHVFALGGTVGNFAAWAEVLIVANTLLVVFNSSINFAFYCGDTVFRKSLGTALTVCADCTRVPPQRELNGNGVSAQRQVLLKEGRDDNPENGSQKQKHLKVRMEQTGNGTRISSGGATEGECLV